MSLVSKEDYVYKNLVSFIENGYGVSTYSQKPTKYLFKITQQFVDDIKDLVENNKSCLSYNKALGNKYNVSEKFIRQYRDAYLLYIGKLVDRPKEKSRNQLLREIEDLKRTIQDLTRTNQSLQNSCDRLQLDVNTYSSICARMEKENKKLKIQIHSLNH